MSEPSDDDINYVAERLANWVVYSTRDFGDAFLERLGTSMSLDTAKRLAEAAKRLKYPTDEEAGIDRAQS